MSYVGQVYKIINDIDDKVYVGSTKQKLSSRMSSHRRDTKNGKNRLINQHMRKLGVDHFTIVLIATYECNNREELRKYEEKHIDELGTRKTGLNQCRAFLSVENRKEQVRKSKKKMYLLNYEANKDELNKKRREEYKKNPEKYRARSKLNYEKNKPFLLKQMKEYSKKNKDKRKKYLEANKEKFRQQRKEYNKRNRDKIAARAKAYRQRNKDKISQRGKQKANCPTCGKEMLKRSIPRHIRNIHKN